MLRLEIIKKNWLRGEGPSSLKNASTGKMCCLGFLAKKCGYSDNDITGKDYPPNTFDNGRQFSFVLPKTVTFDEWSDLARTNDNPDINDTERQQKIRKGMRAIGVDPHFID